MTIEDFLTKKQIKRAFELRKARPIYDEIIAPNIASISYKLGEEMDAMFLSYAVEYTVTACEKRRANLH